MNFKILTVNGQDLSGVSHGKAAEVLQKAAEPIAVVLSRSGGKKDPVESTKSVGYQKVDSSTMASVSTQTQSDSCFCSFLLENSRDISSPLSALIRNELMRYRDSKPERLFCDDNDVESFDGNSPIDDEYYHVEYEEVTLKRPSDHEKLGLTLCDHRDAYSNEIKVVVTDVVPESIAARCQKIYEGDQILKIDGEPVSCMNDASRLLYKDTQTISFLIGHPQIMDDEPWADDDGTPSDNHFRNDDIIRDVRNCISPENNVTSNEAGPRFLESRFQKNRVEYDGGTLAKIQSDTSGTAESALSNNSTRSSTQTGKDSGIGYTLESSVQSASGECTRRTSLDARMFEPTFTEGSKNFNSLTRDFAHRQPQNHRFTKRVTSPQQKTTNKDIADSGKCSMDKPTVVNNNVCLQNINTVPQNTGTKNSKGCLEAFRISSMEFCAEETDEAMSPWVKIARQDYEEKMRQLENSGDLRHIHPALISDDVGNLDRIMTTMSLSCTTSDVTDNTSSAYSTGESFRSSSTTSAPRLSNETISPPRSPGCDNETNKPTRAGVTMTYYMSSDANSDGEGPACYLTHAEDSESEGFEDAGLEFSSTFHSALVQPYRPVPLPRLLHPPREATNFMSHSLTASTKQLWKAAAAVAKSRRQPTQAETKAVHSIEQTLPASELELRGAQARSCSGSTNASGKDPSESDTVVAAKHQNSNLSGESMSANAAHETDYQTNKSSTSDPDAYEPKPTGCGEVAGPKVRRSSEHVRPSAKLIKTQRSFSCIDPPNFDKQKNNENGDQSNTDVQMEWKVRVSKDGTRYITKRPVREKVLRHREKRILAERCGVTTDDDVTELKLGRHWSRDDRKRHLRHAREKKRRRDFMQRCRLEVLNENTPADGEIVELSHKKMTKQKHKRMLLDNFVTVQEILAHGDRSNGVAKVSPLVSVTYI